MFKVKGNEITLIRGDTLLLQVNIKEGDSDYTPQEGDVIRFALKRAVMKSDQSDYLDEKPLVITTIPNDTLLLRLNPQDTAKLPFGKYHYDIEIKMADGFVDTFLSGILILKPEVD